MTRSRWTKYDIYGNDYRDFYKVDLTYDRNSNITSQDDKVLAGWDAKYDIEDLNRVKRSNFGTLASGSITSSFRDEKWTDSSSNLGLSQTGNWIAHMLERDSLSSGYEIDETITFNNANERQEVTSLSKLYMDSGKIDNAYSPNGELRDDQVNYTYEYDAWGRMVAAKTKGGTLVAAYRYNGLGYRIGWHYDVSSSGTPGTTDSVVDSNDPWYHFMYNERWQHVATFRGSDANPKESFVNHAAGFGGEGSSSYIDTVVLRQRDTSTDWWASADSTLDERRYYLQNWRADVIAVTDTTGLMLDQVRYWAYGTPHRYSPVDIADGAGNPIPCGDGMVDAGDYNAFNNAFFLNDPVADIADSQDNPVPDGIVDSGDYNAFFNTFFNELALGRGELSDPAVMNRRGYAGYELDPILANAAPAGDLTTAKTRYHVRNRVLDSSLGVWNRRDPLGYVDGMGLYEYVGSRPIGAADPTGLKTQYTFQDSSGWAWGHVGAAMGGSRSQPGARMEFTLEQKYVCCDDGNLTVDIPKITDYNVPGKWDRTVDIGGTIGVGYNYWSEEKVEIESGTFQGKSCAEYFGEPDLCGDVIISNIRVTWTGYSYSEFTVGIGFLFINIASPSVYTHTTPTRMGFKDYKIVYTCCAKKHAGQPCAGATGGHAMTRILSHIDSASQIVKPGRHIGDQIGRNIRAYGGIVYDHYPGWIGNLPHPRYR